MEPNLLFTLAPILLGYLIGATPFGFIAGKLKGIDIREHGSGNIGATNVLRVLGKPIGLTVFVLDVLKGLVPVWIATGWSDATWVHIATAVATILGHNYTFWLKFRGGKGIATTAGAMLPLIPLPLGVALLLWIITLKVTRYVSIASIAAAVSIPVTATVQALITGQWDPVLLGFAAFIGLLAIWRHRSNIQRLRKGEEHRFGEKKQA